MLLTGETIEIFEPYEVLVHHLQELEQVQDDSQTSYDIGPPVKTYALTTFDRARLSKELRTLLGHVRFVFLTPSELHITYFQIHLEIPIIEICVHHLR